MKNEVRKRKKDIYKHINICDLCHWLKGNLILMSLCVFNNV